MLYVPSSLGVNSFDVDATAEKWTYLDDAFRYKLGLGWRAVSLPVPGAVVPSAMATSAPDIAPSGCGYGYWQEQSTQEAWA